MDISFLLIDNIFEMWKHAAEAETNPSFDPTVQQVGYKFIVYHYYDTPYQSTVFSVPDQKNATESWMNIKLNNDGFIYEKCYSEDATWIQETNWEEHLPNIVSYFRKWCGVNGIMQLYYNKAERRIDIKCRSTKTGNHIIITFEPGFAHYD